MATCLAKGMSVVDPYYFHVCASLTITLHACALKTTEKVEPQLTDC